MKHSTGVKKHGLCHCVAIFFLSLYWNIHIWEHVYTSTCCMFAHFYSGPMVWHAGNSSLEGGFPIPEWTQSLSPTFWRMDSSLTNQEMLLAMRTCKRRHNDRDRHLSTITVVALNPGSPFSKAARQNPERRVWVWGYNSSAIVTITD